MNSEEHSIELNGLEIKPYITSQMNCRIAGSGYVMEALNSNLNIDLSSFPGTIKATIIFSRISGNGKVKINNTFTDVLSKTSHQIDLDIIENKKLEFSRDKDSIGKIVINKIIIINVEKLIEKISRNEFEVTESTNRLKKYNENWKINFIKLGNVRGIKLINDKIYAQEGAQVLHANIIELIETEPPKSFVISNVIKFIYPCEITAVYFKNEFESNIGNKYQHFVKPAKIQSDIYSKLSNTVKNMPSSSQNNIIYDSFISKLDPNYFSNSKDIIANQGKNNNGLLLKREAEFSISISDLKPHMQYVIVANLKKISGNGKFGVAIGTSNGEIRSSCVNIAPDRETELYIKLNTEENPIEGSCYTLKIFRPEDSTVGDVLLERLMITHGMTILNTNAYKDTTVDINKNIISNNVIYNINSVLNNSKKYSRNIINTKTNYTLNFNESICLKTKSSIFWFNKIKSICPNIKISNDSNIAFCELNNLVKAEKIWLEPFDGFISEKDSVILSNAKTIISSSANNINTINKIYPNVKTILLERVWPDVTLESLKYPSGDYITLIHRSKEITDKIISLYDSENNPPLVVIGAIENYPDFVIPMNEYISYNKMLSVIMNSKFLIDIPEITNYMSSILSIVFDKGLPILTSNKHYINKENCNYIGSLDKINNKISESLKYNKINKDINHNKLNDMLSILFNNSEVI